LRRHRQLSPQFRQFNQILALSFQRLALKELIHLEKTDR
jgi:hypothetical protein